MNYRMIYNPTRSTVEMLKLKMNFKNRERLDEEHGDANYGAIAIFQTTLPSLYYFADVGLKAGGVIAEEILGNCPQTLGSMAFFGEISAVEAAMNAVLAAEAAEKPSARSAKG